MGSEINGRFVKTDMSMLRVNSGQIVGLPKNPRKIKPDKLQKLKQSIIDDPEMLEFRPLLVVPHDDYFVIVGGNMRFRAAGELGYTQMPCYTLPAGTSIDKLKAYIIKDNVSYGEDDWGLISSDWNMDQLESWGMDFDGDKPAERSEKILKEDIELKPYDMVHVLISVSPENMKSIADQLEIIKQTEGVEYESSAN